MTMTPMRNLKKSANQYRVDLDYYIASLENLDGGKNVSGLLSLAYKQKRRVSKPNPDFDRDYLSGRSNVWTPRDIHPVAAAAAAADPEKPELAGGPEPVLQPGVYIDGRPFEPKLWSEADEQKIEDLTEEFEQAMEELENSFDDALDVFEDAAEDFGDDPQAHGARFAEAQSDFAEAVLEANELRDVLSPRV